MFGQLGIAKIYSYMEIPFWDLLEALHHVLSSNNNEAERALPTKLNTVQQLDRSNEKIPNNGPYSKE